MTLSKKGNGVRASYARVLIAALALSSCGDGKVTLCNYFPGQKETVGGVMGMWQFRDENGCLWVSGSVHGMYSNTGGCLGPQRCRTITNEEWEAEKSGKPARSKAQPKEEQ